jgi:eukaryotic-like serine/threonine-protein kinase
MEGRAGLEEALFSTALALPTDERDVYLRRACPDASVYARVQALLAALDRGQSLLEGSSPPSFETSDVEVENYQVQRELGEGGWGTVYLAEQLLPVRRTVALKIIKLGMDTKAVILRFAAERQALAMMDHPNIAKVFDAGATRMGRPYFAMELVRGVKITEYCDLIRANVAERTDLFMQVCQAIQHAHRKGVIHRDIKPSNVMITLVDGMPVVKVIDFGVAKAIEGRIYESTLFTAFDHFIGTPAYVSPEQAEYGGARVTARSDIYSLGVLLYELLCGCTPFAANDLSASRLHLLRARIRSAEPLPPSRKLAVLSPEAIALVASYCGTTRSRLIREIHGDLDWVIMHCLEKAPEKRYASAQELLFDLRHYLRDEPVVARPRRLAYSARKFVKRHRAVLSAAAALTVILVSTTFVTAWLALRAARANDLVESFIGFLQDDLGAQDEFSDGADSDVIFRSVLDQAAEKVGKRFETEPLVEASFRGALGAGYASLGSDDHSELQFKRALHIYERQYGVKDPRTVRAMTQVAVSKAKQERFLEAEPVGIAALQLCRDVFSTTHDRCLKLAATVALIQFKAYRHDMSRNTVRDVLEAQKAVLGAEHQATLVSMLIIASVDLEHGELAEAEELARRVFELQKRSLGSAHPRTIMARRLLEEIYARAHKCGSFEETLPQDIELP